jgi:uroporphyrinogen decarboxylase
LRLASDKLSQAERLAKVLGHEEPDRVPCFLMGMLTSGSFWQEFKRREDELLDAYTDDEQNIVLTPCGDYTVPVFFGADVVLQGCPVDEPHAEWVEVRGPANDLEVTRAERGTRINGVETGFQISYYGSINKIELQPNGLAYTWHYAPYLRTPEGLTEWFDDRGWPDQVPVRPFPAGVTETNKRFSKIVHVIPSYGPSSFTHLQTMLGVDRILYFARKDPATLLRIINSFAELQLRQIEQMRSLRPIAVFTFDDLGQKDRSLLAPELFRKFFLPARKKVNDAIHELGAKSILHSCGNATELLPDLVAAGFDGWQTLEPASGIDHADVKKRFGDRLSFWGGVDNNVLCFGTPAEVEAEVKRMIRVMAPGGGYLLGPAHDYLNTRVDNALVLRDALTRYGGYPLGD